jgi:hypothetical protein
MAYGACVIAGIVVAGLGARLLGVDLGDGVMGVVAAILTAGVGVLLGLGVASALRIGRPTGWV